MQKRDYLEDLITQIAAGIARIMGLVGEKKFEDADRAIDAAWSSIGFRRSDAARLDDSTLRALLGLKIDLAARLLEVESAFEEAKGNQAAAEALRRRSANLRSR
jgi:hypothetical protein